MEQKPSIGRIVHVDSRGPDSPVVTHPVIITEVHEGDRISGVAFINNPGHNSFGVTDIPQGEGLLQWRWPPRV